MSEAVFANARLVLGDDVVAGSLVVRGGMITGIAAGPCSVPHDDCEGDYLLPGLVELHTDHLEGHYHPRPGVSWPAVPAVISHDAQIAAAGITTVFDALRAGTFDPDDISARHAGHLLTAINEAQATGHLRADHFIHLRCEIPCSDTLAAAEHTAAAGNIHLMSIMDHTPGARQFTSLDKFKEYYLGKKLILPEKLDAYIAEKLDLQARHAAANKRGILDLARSLGVRLASHDDATRAHVDEAVADGVVVAEFPTTAEAAAAAHGHGLAVLMGAPNVVRGGSHSGNISASSVAAGGHLDILSSDYVPASLLAAAFALPRQVEGLSLPQAIACVTRNPARSGGLDDRGEIATGLLADLIQVRLVAGLPVVRRVWRRGTRVI